MVSLATTPLVPRELSLRDAAFWYPSLPDADLDLNEEGFTAKELATTSYEPVHWTNFAGPNGEYLNYLTAISVFADKGSPKCIEFHYSNNDVPWECRKVGRCTPSQQAEFTKFDINGAEGERINYLTVYNRHNARSKELGMVTSIEIMTNWGNWNLFGAGDGSENAGEVSTVAAEGFDIHGLYWTQSHNKIMSLGAMTAE